MAAMFVNRLWFQPNQHPSPLEMPGTNFTLPGKGRRACRNAVDRGDKLISIMKPARAHVVISYDAAQTGKTSREIAGFRGDKAVPAQGVKAHVCALSILRPKVR